MTTPEVGRLGEFVPGVAKGMEVEGVKVSAQERVARAMLSYLAEPGGGLLGRIVAALGAEEAVEVLRSGVAPKGVVRGERDRRTLEGWRMRVPSARPEEDLDLCERYGGRFICPGEQEWPSQLDDLGAAAPHGLWVRGSGDLRYGCLRSVAVVGARAATPYGIRAASDLGAELSDRGWTVVSGAALGIDAAAHRGVLASTAPECAASTIGVLACGVDVPYPPRNEPLLAEMAQRAVLVSEWPPGTHPTRGRFLVRNRVIAALTRGTVIVEADLRSGSLNTAGYAEQLNRHVLALPGPVTSRMSRGCHQWIRDGRAVCVSDAAEVIESIGTIGEDLAPERRGPVLPRDRLDAVSQRVLDAVPTRTPAVTEEIAVRAGTDLNTTRSRLTLLAAAGFLENTEAGWRLPKEHTP